MRISAATRFESTREDSTSMRVAPYSSSICLAGSSVSATPGDAAIDPKAPGEFFFGHEKFWIYRHEIRIDGKRHPPRMIGLRLRRPDGLILEGMNNLEQPLHHKHIWIEPELLAESFDSNRALSIPISLRELPEHVWQAVLAAEDARFFEHSGLDAKSLARAMLKNAKAGKVVQGGSTITQQLVKMRDLSPKRSLGRKASEAARALALEAEYDKSEILEAYLNAVYYGHIEGVHIYGLGTAAKAYFSKSAARLSLEEAALLAAMIQGPNRLSPVRNPQNVVERYEWVLTRMVAVDWLEPSRMHTAHRQRPAATYNCPRCLYPAAPHFLDWLESEVESEAPKRAEEGRGAVVYSTLDPLLQEAAEDAVRQGSETVALRSLHDCASSPWAWLSWLWMDATEMFWPISAATQSSVRMDSTAPAVPNVSPAPPSNLWCFWKPSRPVVSMAPSIPRDRSPTDP